MRSGLAILALLLCALLSIGIARAQSASSDQAAIGYYLAEDYPRAYTAALWSAREGNLDAQFVLGLLNLRGQAILKNLNAAADLLSRASSAGHIPSKAALGAAFVSGELPRDPARGRKLLEEAASTGDGMANFSLATMYFNGIDVLASPETALRYAKAAAAAPDRMNKAYAVFELLGRIHQSQYIAAGGGSAGQLTSQAGAAEPERARELRRQAAQWYRKALETGRSSVFDDYLVVAEAQEGLSLVEQLARDGKGEALAAYLPRARSPQERLSVLKEAADRGCGLAMGVLAIDEFEGRYGSRDLQTVMKLLQDAPTASNTAAMGSVAPRLADVASKIGDMHFSGKGLAKDADEAARWWRIAFNLGGPSYQNEPLRARLDGLENALEREQSERRRLTAEAEYRRDYGLPFESPAIPRRYTWNPKLRELFKTNFWIPAISSGGTTSFDGEYDTLFKAYTNKDQVLDYLVMLKCLKTGVAGMSITVGPGPQSGWSYPLQDGGFIGYTLTRSAFGVRGKVIASGNVDARLMEGGGSVSVLAMRPGDMVQHAAHKDVWAGLILGAGGQELYTGARRVFSPDPASYSPVIDINELARATEVEFTFKAGAMVKQVKWSGHEAVAYANYCAGKASRFDVREAGIQTEEFWMKTLVNLAKGAKKP